MGELDNAYDKWSNVEKTSCALNTTLVIYFLMIMFIVIGLSCQ